MCFFNNEFGFDFAKDLSYFQPKQNIFIDQNMISRLKIEQQDFFFTDQPLEINEQKNNLLIENESFHTFENHSEVFPFFYFLNTLQHVIGFLIIKNSDNKNHFNSQSDHT